MIGTVKQIIGSIKHGVTAQKLQKINLRVIGLTFVIIGITVPLLSAQQHKKKLNEFLTLYELSGMQNSDAAEDLQQLIEVHLENASLEQALVAIADKADLKLMYSKSLLPEEGRITLSEQSITLYDALWKILDETGLRFALSQNHQLVLLKKQNKKLETVQETITGEVTDAQTGETLPGVNILVKGTSTGASTDASGQYELTVESLQDTLVVSFVGYKTKQVPINGRTEVNVALQTQAISGEEMVVVGYGTQRKENLTGAVSQISTEELDEQPLTSLSKGLQGKIPNLNITTGSGRPGSGGTLNIRGNTSITSSGEPLVLIDGIPGDIDDINSNNVKNVTVLKDASASAIYGARAAFGVILITTKSGKAGEPKITYSNNFSWKTFEVNTDFITTGWDWLQIAEESYKNALGRKFSGYSKKDYDEIYKRRNDGTENPDRPWVMVKQDALGRDVYKYYGNFDWFDYYYNKWRPKQKHDLSIQGGSDEMKYFLSGSISNEKGIYKHNTDVNKRINFRSKIDYKVYPWLTIRNNTTLFSSDYTYPGEHLGGFSEVHGNLTSNQFYHLSPTYVPKNPDGTYTYLKDNGTYQIGYGNHIAIKNKNVGGSNTEKKLRTTFEVQIDPIDNLELTGNYSYNYGTGERNYREVPLSYSLYPGETGIVSAWDEDHMQKAHDKNNDQVINIYGNYKKSFGLHNLKITAGFNQHLYKYNRIYSQGYDFLSRSKNDYNLLTGRSELNGGQSEWALRGYFYRVNYSYNDKYLLEVSGRYDGTSRFPKGDRFGYFPSFSVGYVVSNESFFEPLNDILNLFKMRASYGTLGNQVVNDYAYISGMSAFQMGYLNAANKQLTAINSPNPVSPSLTWEEATTKNIGIDIGTLNNRLSITLDAYIRDTKGMLVKGKTLPSVFGAPEPKENAANLEVKGYELSIAWKDELSMAGSQFSYNFGFHLSDYTGEITKFDNPDKVISDYYTGQKLGDIWGFVYDGFFETIEEAQAHDVDQSRLNRRRVAAPTAELRKLQAGDIKIIDLNGNGKIDYGDGTIDNPGDRKVIGNSQPRWKYGFQVGGSYKGFNISAVFQGIGHRDYYPENENQRFWNVYARPYGSFIPKNFADKMWNPDNRDAYFPRVIGYTAQNSELSVPNNMYLQNLAYLKLRNLTIGYELPTTLVSKVGLKQARVYVNGYNLFTWTSFDTDYIDPEEVMRDENARGYPMGKSYSFGVSITF